jgi:regulator of chromosome condensation
VGVKDAVDIYCGNHHSFYKNSKGSIFAWGLNTHGQLGIGNRMNTCTPTKIKEFENLDIKQIAGGEHHSIACTRDGRVFCWGRNDEG